MDHIRNQQATDILEAMERLNQAGYSLTVSYDTSQDATLRHVVSVALNEPIRSVLAGLVDVDETVTVRRATLRDALAHLIQILEG